MQVANQRGRRPVEQRPVLTDRVEVPPVAVATPLIGGDPRATALSPDADGKKQKVTTRVGYNRVEVQKRRPDGSTYTGFRSVRISRRTGEEI